MYSAGDVIAEIETDKATMEVEAVDEGKLGRILVAEGAENVAVNTPIAFIIGEGESAHDAVASPAPAADVTEPTPAPAAPVPPAPPVIAPAKPACSRNWIGTARQSL